MSRRSSSSSITARNFSRSFGRRKKCGLSSSKVTRCRSTASDVPGEEDIDHWTLTTLRCIQFQELGDIPEIETGSIPAYTRDGYERVQNLRLTVAEAQFASQFNGVRSVAQIAKNLRLDFKFARLTLFRFLALEIVECWPPATATSKPEKRGFFQKFGFGE